MKVSIHPNHGCKSKNMTPNQLINHLKNKEDSNHKAILVYLTKQASFQQGPARKNPAKNSFYTVPTPQPFPMTQANDLDNEVNVNEVGGGEDGTSRINLASAGTTSHINGGKVEGKVGGGGDIWCRMAMAMAGPTSHTNEDNNEVKGKVVWGGMANL